MNDQSVMTDSDETIDLLWKALANGATLKDIRGVSDEVMEGIYAYAYDFYQKGRAKDAETFFRFLCLYDMYNPDYSMGLAAALHQQKKYQQAATTYELTFALAKNDYRALLHAGQCHLMLKNPKQARICFSVIVDSNKPSPLTEKAQAYLSAMKSPENENESEEEIHE